MLTLPPTRLDHVGATHLPRTIEAIRFEQMPARCGPLFLYTENKDLKFLRSEILAVDDDGDICFATNRLDDKESIYF